MSVRRTSPILVGRGEELRLLEEAVAGRAERPVVLVGGEAGVGKSRLVAELGARATSAGATVVVGSCIELGADLLPYAPFVESLGRLVEELGDRADELVGAARPDLAPLLPDLDRAVGLDSSGGGSRGRLYESVRAVLDRAPDPLVLVLEDIHWADRSSLELLDYLARRLRHGRTLVVATYRTDELHRRHPLVPVLAELGRTGRATRLELGRLEPPEIAVLVQAIGEDVPPATVEAIVGRSEGNPFLVEELVAAGAVGPTSPLPATLQDLLLARVGSLDASTRRALGIVAAVGRPVDAELVELAWDGSRTVLDEALREAVDRALLVVQPAGRRLAFRHALLAEAIDADLLPGERVRLHETLARILAERPDLGTSTTAGAAAELAHHLLESRDLAAALAASVRAADAAATARAYAEARTLYERALELFERVPDAPARAAVDRATLLDHAAEANFHAGDPARAVALGQLAVAESERAADPARTGYLLVRLIEWTEGTSDHAGVHPLAELAVELVPAAPPSPERAFALLGLASARMHESRNLEGARVAGEAAAVASACGAVGYEAISRSLAAITLMALCRAGEAIGEIEAAVALAERSRGTEEVVIVHGNRAGLYGYLGRRADQAEAIAAARRAIDREGALAANEAFLAAGEGAILAWEGRWDEAEALCSRFDEASTSPQDRADHLIVRGAIRVRRGLLEAGERDLRGALAHRPLVFLETAAEALSLLAEAALGRGDPAGALALVDDGLDALAPGDDLPWRAHLFALGLRAAADLAERSGARRERQVAALAERAALAHREHLQAALEGRLVEGGGVDDLLRAKAAWGFAEASRGDGVPDPSAWAEAASTLTLVGETHIAAYCRFREAEAALAGPGDRARALEALRVARAWALKVGAEPLLRDVEALARRARIDLVEDAVELPGDTVASPAASAPAPADPYGLSPREREVLALLVDGRTNREIGAVLFISEKTASVHVSHILDKMGVTSRGAAAALAARAGLVDAPGR